MANPDFLKFTKLQELETLISIDPNVSSSVIVAYIFCTNRVTKRDTIEYKICRGRAKRFPKGFVLEPSKCGSRATYVLTAVGKPSFIYSAVNALRTVSSKENIKIIDSGLKLLDMGAVTAVIFRRSRKEDFAHRTMANRSAM